MTQAAKAQEPSMEEILASIRRIIADDDVSKPAKAPEQASVAAAPAAASVATSAKPSVTPAPSKPAAPPAPSAKPSPAAAANSQDDIDAMLAELDAPPKAAVKSAPMPPPTPAPTPVSSAMTASATASESKPGASPSASLPAADVLDLTESMTSQVAPPPKPAPSFQTIDGTSDVVFATKAPEPMPERALISNETVAAVDSAFNSLAHTLIGQNARTLEDLVREMLRPMLKSWLDDNLPGMVERIVRAEIERVSRGR
jgi:uncharacterized protein